MTQRKLLIDADIFAYKATWVCAEEFEWGPGLISNVVDVHQAIEEVEAMVAPITRQFESEDVVFCFSDSRDKTFRRKLYPEYKANRGARQPLAGLSRVKDWFIDQRPCALWDCLEADDVMGIMATRDPSCVIVSADKDMQTLPAQRFNPDKDTQVQVSSVAEADHFHMIQTLTGDTTDHYPGCKGIGVVRAAALLSKVPKDDPAAMWAVVVGAFEKAGFDEDYALIQARLARICRDGDWDVDRQEMIWKPKE